MNLLAYKPHCLFKAVHAGCLSRAIEKDLQLHKDFGRMRREPYFLFSYSLRVFLGGILRVRPETWG